MLGWVLCYMEMNQRINAGGLVQTKGPRNPDNLSRTTGFKVSDQCLPLGFLQSGYLRAPGEHTAVESWEGRVETLLPPPTPPLTQMRQFPTRQFLPHPWAVFRVSRSVASRIIMSFRRMLNIRMLIKANFSLASAVQTYQQYTVHDNITIILVRVCDYIFI